MVDKERLRREFLAARKTKTPDAVAGASAVIAERLMALPVFRDASVVLTYVGSKDNEVDTRGLIAALIAEGRDVLAPMAAGVGCMHWASIRSLDDLRPGRYGILEPAASGQELRQAPDEGVCLTPGLVFCRNGYRIGYGGGFFDRFLANYNGVSIGLAYADQLVGDLPVETHDRPVDWIVTEHEAFETSPIRATAQP